MRRHLQIYLALVVHQVSVVKKEMWKYYLLISSCFLEISHNSTSVETINIDGSSSSISQFEGRVWFDEPVITAGIRKTKVGGGIVGSLIRLSPLPCL